MSFPATIIKTYVISGNRHQDLCHFRQPSSRLMSFPATIIKTYVTSHHHQQNGPKPSWQNDWKKKVFSMAISFSLHLYSFNVIFPRGQYSGRASCSVLTWKLFTNPIHAVFPDSPPAMFGKLTR
jgi:hypothetical protein